VRSDFQALKFFKALDMGSSAGEQWSQKTKPALKASVVFLIKLIFKRRPQDRHLEFPGFKGAPTVYKLSQDPQEPQEPSYRPCLLF
jgi:hypothetical protein